jgi:hypothetical protein
MYVEIHFTIAWSSEEGPSAFPLPDDYEYWRALVPHFLNKTDSIEIHCWNEEQEAIKEIQSELDCSVHVGDNMTIFKGSNVQTLPDILLNKYEMKNKFKWFTVNLIRHGEIIFHSGHWATEFAVTAENAEEAAWVQSVTPKDTEFFFY